MSILETIWGNVKSIRKSKKISQVKLSELTWLDRSFLSNVESGKVNPSVLSLEKIAVSLGVEVKELF